MQTMDIRNISVGGEPGRRVDITAANCLAVDTDRDFLKPFQGKRKNAGYVGMGKFVDAVARLAYGRQADAAMQGLRQHIISVLLESQDADGYIGTFDPEARFVSLWDIHETAYLVFGLVTNFELWKEPASLEAARRLADCLIRQWQAGPERVPRQYVMTTLGVETAMLALYRQTRDRAYLDFCLKDTQIQEWDAPIVAGRWGRIEGHVYNYFNRCLAQLELNRLAPDAQLERATRRALDFMFRQDGLAITGATGDHECWHDTQDGTINLGETCATAYMLKLLDVLLRRTQSAFYGDVMERAAHNALFAAQSPAGRQIRYYTPFDGPRRYFKKDTFCCPNNYRRIIAELPGLVYYMADGDLAVNLYAPSTIRTTLDGGVSVTLEQVTEYPRSGRVLLRVNPAQPARFGLRLRMPLWCNAPSLTVNGQPVDPAPRPGEFYRIEREWRPGDEAALEFPMPFRLVKGRQAQAGRVAVMRGPMLFCLNRARHAELADMDLRLLVLDTQSVEGPLDDASVHAGGQACRIRAWKPGSIYPDAKPELALTLTEFADPGGEAVYFKVPDPNQAGLLDDEFLAGYNAAADRPWPQG